MHLPQVRCLRIAAEARLSMHPAPEHCQREDVRVHLVLVLDPARSAHRADDLPVRILNHGDHDNVHGDRDFSFDISKAIICFVLDNVVDLYL